MVDLDSRLARCFLAVFPDLDNDELRHATPDTVPDWDSVRFITLITVIEEEFGGVQIDVEAYERLSSYQALAGYLESRP